MNRTSAFRLVPRHPARFLALALAALGSPAPLCSQPPVLVGIDVVDFEHYRRLNKTKIGLFASSAARNRHGQSTLDALRRAKNLQVVALFRVEFGGPGETARAAADERIAAEAKVRVHVVTPDLQSIDPAWLEGCNALVYDVPDTGSRWQPQADVLRLALRTAYGTGMRLQVLDRPNPLGAAKVGGPIADPAPEGAPRSSGLPVLHGMTIAELAYYYNENEEINADLRLAHTRNWERDQPFAGTDLFWSAPVDGVDSASKAWLYATLGMLETTNVSLGMHTGLPYEVIGAPWVDGRRLTRHLQNAAIPGLTFVARRFVPRAGPFAGQACQGVQLAVTNGPELDPVLAALHIACGLRDLHGGKWQVDAMAPRLQNAAILAGLKAGKTPSELAEIWLPTLKGFAKVGSAFSLYTGGKGEPGAPAVPDTDKTDPAPAPQGPPATTKPGGGG
ncbi:MAG: exo-beta-N-acetylmuramidase NamZ domain-containing protein [Planctomycetota bacterium]